MGGTQVEQTNAVSQARALSHGLFKAWCLNLMWKNKGSCKGWCSVTAEARGICFEVLVQRWHTGIWGGQNRSAETQEMCK